MNIAMIANHNGIAQNGWEDGASGGLDIGSAHNSTRIACGCIAPIQFFFRSFHRHQYDADRSIPFAAVAPLAEVSKARFFSLQLGSPALQIREPGNAIPLIDFTGDLKNMADTAGLISQLDLVIAVDTAVAHLAGAMGKKVWLLLPFVPDWRWMLQREDSPWYPTMRLFRQKRIGDWTDVIERVRGAFP
jgi:hypothetical protein